MHILHVGLNDWEKIRFEKYLETSLKDEKHIFCDNKEFTEMSTTVLSNVEVLTVFIHDQVTSETISMMPKLKLIVTRSTGFDHIDLDSSKGAGVVVCNVPAYGSNTVAEHTFSLLLFLAKNLGTLANRTTEANFEFKDKLGFDLYDQTLGIIGAGRIGKNVIQIARGFDMSILAHDLYRDDVLAEVLNYKYVELDELLSDVDILSLHTPINNYTKSILSRNNVLKIKPNTVFLNTSRGSLISNEDLLFALDNGIFSCAGLDAMDGEEEMFKYGPNSLQKELLSRKNVVYTPHSAFYTSQALERILKTSVENISRFIQNKPVNVVV